MKVPHLNYAKILAVVAFLLVWEAVARVGVFSSFLFPSVTDSITWAVTNSTRLFNACCYTLKLLLTGLGIAIGISVLVSMVAVMFYKLRPVVETFVSLFQPIPAIAILPFALLWFGLGDNPIIFVTIFGSVWVLILNVMNGFTTINRIYINVGRNYGLKGFELTWHIMIPVALPSILTGIRTAWGTAWRTVVAAELVFGAVGITGGLGWLIYINRYALNAPGMLAAVGSIALIGIIVENALFGVLERKTVKKWGMKT